MHFALEIFALIHQRLRAILEHVEPSENVKENLDTLRNAFTETQEDVEKAHHNLEDDGDIKQLINRIYEKPGTDMGDLWVSFMEIQRGLMETPMETQRGLIHGDVGPSYPKY